MTRIARKSASVSLTLYSSLLFLVLCFGGCLPAIKLCKTEVTSELSFPYYLTLISVDGQVIADVEQRIFNERRSKDHFWVEQFTVYHYNGPLRLCLDPGRHTLELRFERLMKGSYYISFDALARHQYVLHVNYRVSPLYNIMGRKRVGPVVEESLIPLTWIESWSMNIVDQADDSVVASTDKSSYDREPWIAQGIRAKNCGYIDVKRVRTPWQILFGGVACPAEGQPFHKEAKAFTQKMIGGKELKIHPEKMWHDTFSTAWVEVEGKSLNEELVANGLAWASRRHHGNKRLVELEKAAREKKIGIWSKDDAIPPWLFRDLSDGREKGLEKAASYSQLGDRHLARGELQKAKEWYDRALELNEALDNKDGMANQYDKLLSVSKAHGRLDVTKEAAYRKSTEIIRTIGERQKREKKELPSDRQEIYEAQKTLEGIRVEKLQ